MQSSKNALILGVFIAGLSVLVGCSAPAPVAEEPQSAVERLPSWQDSAARSAILGFVERVSDASSPDFVSEPERIAVFDNDG
ncbi:MAG TPA: hypothetical protein VLT32_05625, partial [Candidatus Sulfomarinibacteraceae bacterium]|nr:hypothetical protein [Candidatus Sulfomarinibacteraceae bacterium]